MGAGTPVQAERDWGALLPSVNAVWALAAPSFSWGWDRGLGSSQKVFPGAAVGFPACPASVRCSSVACAPRSFCSSPRHCRLACKPGCVPSGEGLR